MKDFLSKHKKPFIIVIALLIIGVFAAFIVPRFSKPGAEEGPPSSTATAEKKTINSTVSATGNVSIDEPEDVLASVGVLVDSVNVKVGDEVKKGKALAEIDGTSIVSELIRAKEIKSDLKDQLEDDDISKLKREKLRGEITEVNERISDLENLREDPVIRATVSGVISAVNVYDGENVTINSSPGKNNDNETEEAIDSDAASMLPGSALTPVSMELPEAFPVYPLLAVSDTYDEEEELPDPEEDNPEDYVTDEPTVITDISSVRIETPKAGEVPQREIAPTTAYTGTISWTPADNPFRAGVSYTATVTLTVKDDYIFRGTYAGANIADNGAKLELVRTFEKTEEEEDSPSEEELEKRNRKVNPEKKVRNGNNARSGNGPTISGSGNGGSFGGSSGLGGGSGFGSSSLSSESSSGASSSYSSSGEETEFYGTHRAVAFSIKTMEAPKILINIDELDILSIEKGQDAEITVDALDGEEIDGEISKVNTTGKVSNGNTKYEVLVSIDKNKKIMDGMSASVTIVTDKAIDAVSIPVAAVQEREEKEFVYTSVDKNGNLSGEKAVETGLSDGKDVEIKSGLSEGDTVYFEVATGDDTMSMVYGEDDSESEEDSEQDSEEETDDGGDF